MPVKKLILFLFPLVFVFLFLFPKSTFAQTCSGSVTCCDAAHTVLVQTPPGCTPGVNCTWATQCTNGGNGYACSFGGPGNTCGLWVPDSLCNFQMSGSCVYSPPSGTPPPGPTPPPSSSCVSGDCFTGIANCGAVGRPNQTGTCVMGGTPGLCCAWGGGGGACTVWNIAPSPVTINVGQTIPLTSSAYNGIFETHVLNVRWSMGPFAPWPNPTAWGIQQDAFARLGVLNSAGWSGNNWRDPQTISNVNNTITGLAPGITTARVDYQVYSINDGAFVNNANCNKAVTVTVLPSPPPSCTVTANPNPVVLGSGVPATLVANVVPTNGTVDSVSFSSVNPGIATVSPASDASFAYQTSVSPVSAGSTTVNISVTMGGVVRCSTAATVNVNNVTAWWQVNNGDVTANGNLQSLVPSTCAQPGCNPNFIVDGTGGFPGVAVYGGSTYDFSSGAGNGSVSSRNWLARTTYNGATYNSTYIKNLIGNNVTWNNLSGSITAANLTSGGTATNGYYWYRVTGSTTITENVDLTTRKVILLVDGGNLNIAGTINLSQGAGFFMAIAGQTAAGTGGNITITPAVQGSPYALKGIYLADRQIRTGSASQALRVLGSMAAWQGYNLQRDLGVGNATGPAEVFTYDASMISLFPSILVKDTVIWREIAP